MITQTSSSLETLFGIDISLSNNFGMSIFQLCPWIIFYYIHNNNTIGPKILELKGMNNFIVNFDLNSYYFLNYDKISETII